MKVGGGLVDSAKVECYIGYADCGSVSDGCGEFTEFTIAETNGSRPVSKRLSPSRFQEVRPGSARRRKTI